MLKAGYLEDWEYHDTLSGVPQGGVVSPILSNIYLHKLDEFVEQELIPSYTRGDRRRNNPEYHRLVDRLTRARQRGDRAAARDLRKRLRELPSRDLMDPGYRRLRYIRYADDQLLGLIGSKAEAEKIKATLARFLRETLGLELNAGKTLITHARSRRRGSSAMTYASSIATRNAPEAAVSPTGRSHCGYRRMSSRPSAPATGNTVNRGTGPGYKISTTTTSSRSTEPNTGAS